MMRSVMLLSATALLLTACQQAKPDAPAAGAGATAPTVAANGGKVWSETVTRSPEGGFVMGNPDAKVKLVEYGSLTCTHCAEFAKEADQALIGTYVNSGKVSYEIRNFTLNALDVPASLIVRCAGEKRFFPMTANTFAGQADIFEGAKGITPEIGEELQATPPAQLPAKIAKVAKIDEFYKARGMTGEEIDQCLARTDDMAVLEKMNNEAVEKYKVTGTPAFFIGGKPVEMKGETSMWTQVEAALKAAGA